MSQSTVIPRNPPKSSSKPKILLCLYDGGKAADEEPRLLGATKNALGIKEWAEKEGYELIVTDDKEGEDSAFRKHIVDAEVLITTPFHPAYLTKEIMATAKNLQLALTAGVGSDHIDLNAANERKICVAEVTGSNVVAVAEHVMMSILLLVRNFVPAHEQIINGEWDVGQVVRNSFDLEGMVVGTVGAGRIGYRVLQRLKPFDCKELLYFDYTELPKEAAESVGVKRVEKLEDMLAQCDVVTINCPLHEKTKGMFNKDLLKHMKKGSWLVNTARGAICVAEDIAEALESGHLNGYAGDVWYPQPAPADHPWRKMRNHLGGGNGMTPHISGSSLTSQQKYAAGSLDILKRYFADKDQELANLIVINGEYASKAYGEREKKKAENEKAEQLNEKA